MQLQQKARSSPSIATRKAAQATGLGLGWLSRARFPLPPALTALFIQLASALMTLSILAPVLEMLGIHPGLLAMAFLQGGGALWISRHLGQAFWWRLIHLFFVPAIVVAQAFAIAPAWFLAAFLLLLLVYWSVFRSQVPLYLSSRQAWHAVADLLPAESGVSLIDLGAGLGGLLNHLSRIRPDGRFSGMEIAPLPFALAWLRKTLSRGRYQISRKDFWSHHLASYDVVYAYLSPVPMSRVWEKACVEMRPGSCFISNTFEVPGIAPVKTIDLDDFHHSRLYVYRIPAQAGAVTP